MLLEDKDNSSHSRQRESTNGTAWKKYSNVKMTRALLPFQKMDQMKRNRKVLSILAFVFASSVQAQESRCDIFPFPSNHCAQNITITIEKRLVEMRKSLTLLLESQGIKEPVVMLNYVRDHTCETSTGYLCSKVTKSTFSIIAPCAPNGSFRLSVDGEQDISCVGPQQKMQLFELDAGRRKSEDSDLQKTSEQKEVPTGLIVGISIAIAAVIIGVFFVTTFILFRRRQQSKRQGNSEEESDDFTAESKEALTSRSSDGGKPNS